MPTTQKPSEINAKRVANLLAGFDMGNPVDAEAINHGLALRHLAAKHGMRIVDILELPEVRQAVDEQLGPKRIESHELEELQALRKELIERLNNGIGERSHSFGAQSWVVEVTGIAVALVLMMLAIF
jgi:hypothetical protein